MSLKHLSNDELLKRLNALTQKERTLQAEIIEYLREVDTRKLYRDLGYSSLFEYLTRGLKYSEGAAQRRIDAARLSASVPEVSAKLRTGELTLMSLARVQSVIRLEEKRTGKKLATSTKRHLVNEIAGKTAEEAQATLFAVLPEASLEFERLRKESLRPVDDENSRLSLILNEQLKRKLERVREVAARQLQNQGSWAELIELLVDEYLERHDPVKKAERILKKKSATATVAANANAASAASQPQSGTTPARPGKKRRPIPASIRHLVWQRDQGCCQYKDPVSGIQCKSRRYLEIDHIVPVAKGGTNALNNLRLLCRAHNQLRAEKDFGERRRWTLVRHHSANSTT